MCNLHLTRQAVYGAGGRTVDKAGSRHQTLISWRFSVAAVSHGMCEVFLSNDRVLEKCVFDCAEKTLLSQMQHIAWQDMISKLIPREMKLHGFFLCFYCSFMAHSWCVGLTVITKRAVNHSSNNY